MKLNSNMKLMISIKNYNNNNYNNNNNNSNSNSNSNNIINKIEYRLDNKTLISLNKSLINLYNSWMLIQFKRIVT